MTYPTKAAFTFDWTAQLTSPSWSPEQTKTNFGAQSEELRVALNAVTAILNAITDGTSGADNLGMTAIAALGTEATVQSIIEALVTQIQSVSAGDSGAKFTGVETIAGLTGNDVQTLLAAIKTNADALVVTVNAKAPTASPNFTGTPTAPTGTDYTTARLRNVILASVNPTSGDGADGDVWIKYIV